jgi:asparagine synthase (glutamine-hydrolysing)
MCGLAGIVALDGGRVEPSELEPMLAAIRRRGPDSQGVYAAGQIALGFRRLRIIDLSPSADQPMLLPDQSLAVVSNGEIYNYRALRKELAGLGHQFKTHSDTEVILHAWRQWGGASVARLHGMFAIAVWDQKAGKLTLVRDRTGKKPLYFCVRANRLLFASELKALAKSPAFDANVDLVALKDYLAFGYVTGSRCIFREVEKLPPACTMTIDLSPTGARIGSPQCYWELPVPTRTPPSRAETELLPALDRLLDVAVQDRMVSDVPVGAFLSGGIDSSLVVSYMAQHARGRLRAFSIGYPGHPSDESPFAELVAKKYGIDYHTHFLDPDDYTDPKVINDVYDEPFADPSAAATLKLCEVTKKAVTVALSGDGGDELFGGYPRYQSALRANLLRYIPSPAKAAARFLLAAVPSERAREFRQILAQSPSQLYSFLLGQRPRYLGVLTERAASGLFADEGSSVERLMSQISACDFATAMMATDVCGYLPDDILVKVDRASMHFALEVRCPFLDTRVIDFAFGLPSASKVSLRHTKILLKQLAARRLPQEIVDRPKQGFVFPLADWLRGPLRAPLESLLSNNDHHIWTIYCHEALRERFRAHLERRADSSWLCWRVMILANWLDKYAVTVW